VYLKDKLSLYEASSFVLYDRQALSLVWRVLQKPCIRVEEPTLGGQHISAGSKAQFHGSALWTITPSERGSTKRQAYTLALWALLLAMPHSESITQHVTPLLTPSYLPFNNHYMFCTQSNLTELSPRKLTGNQKGGQLLKWIGHWSVIS
jgi:hypothetical protein